MLIVNQLIYVFYETVPQFVKFLRKCGLDDAWIFILLVLVPLYFLFNVIFNLTERVSNVIRTLRDGFLWFVNGYYRILYMMNPGFRTVVELI